MAELVMRFELQLLSELGFGLDLSQCAATGSHADLVYVSPKSGRAVSRAAGEPWRDKLLRLPAFLADPDAAPTTDDLAAGFALTGHFLTVHVLDSRGAALSAERERFIAAVLQRARSAPAT
jgi:DNA repair protein RecO (recombination protein O)